jgi:hypothetical protein
LSLVTTDAAASAADLTLDADGEIVIDAADAAGVIIKINGTAQLSVVDGSITPTTNNDIDLGTSSYQFKDGYFDGTLEADDVTIGGTNVVTGSLVTTLGTVSAGVWQGTAIASTYIAADAITGAKIADDAIDSEHYTDGSIDNAHLADDAVDSDELAAGAIDTAHIADNQVTVAKIEDIARGSIIYGNASAASAELTKGSANYVLTSDGTDIAWAAASAGAVTYEGGNTSEASTQSFTAVDLLSVSSLTIAALQPFEVWAPCRSSDPGSTVSPMITVGKLITASGSVVIQDAVNSSDMNRGWVSPDGDDQDGHIIMRYTPRLTSYLHGAHGQLVRVSTNESSASQGHPRGASDTEMPNAEVTDVVTRAIGQDGTDPDVTLYNDEVHVYSRSTS